MHGAQANMEMQVPQEMTTVDMHGNAPISVLKQDRSISVKLHHLTSKCSGSHLTPADALGSVPQPMLVAVFVSHCLITRITVSEAI